MNLRENLGKIAEDNLTNKRGIIVSRGNYLYGCDRYGFLPQDENEDKEMWVCADRLTILDDVVVEPAFNDETPILLGKEVKDKVTGLEGLLTARMVSLYDCDSYMITPPAIDNKHEDSLWVDGSRIEVIRDHVSTEDFKSTRPGGPETTCRY